jgi:LytS/YehU family sensor histidine kinase
VGGMSTGTATLAAAVVALWVVVHLVTQVASRPPLGTGWTIVIGVALTTVLLLAHPAGTRSPRGQRAPLRPADAGGPGTTIALIGRGMPLRSGLTAKAADRTVRLLRPLLGGDAVAITDVEEVLAFAGPGSDHHERGAALVTDATQRVLATGRTVVIRDRDGIGCPTELCPLRSAVVAPLTIRDEVIGTLKVYRIIDAPPSRELVEGMAGILSLHLELHELDRERQLAADARLDSLRAQINPHFLFNTLNTIASKARTDPEEARELLLRLSDFFRYAIRQEGHFADFDQEYFFVQTYLSLEKARFGDRLEIHYDVDPHVHGVQVPVLTIQPLVENAVKHGLAEKVDGGSVWMKVRVDPLRRTTNVQVRDDGVGMDADTLARVLSGSNPDGGIGLRNISERLTALFDGQCRFDIRSAPGEGTTVDLQFPLR